MKKLYILMALCLTATAASAATKQFRQEAKSLPTQMSFTARAVKPAREPEAGGPDILIERPAGTHYANMWRDSKEYQVIGYEVGLTEETGLTAEMVDGDDGHFYVRDLVWGYNSGVWLKGDRAEGDTIVFNFPQTIYYDEYDGDITSELMYRVKYDAERKTFVPDEETSSVKFVFADGELRQAEDNYIGIFDDYGEWNGYASNNITIKAAPYQRAEPQAETERHQCSLVYGADDNIDGAAFVKTAVEGDKLYIQGFNSAQPDLWAEGTIADGVVTIKNKQYLGADLYNRRHCFLLTCDESEVWDDEYEEYVPILVPMDEMKLDYDADKQTITGRKYLVVNMNDRYINFTDIYADPRIEPWTEVAATPKDPVIQGLSTDYEQVIRFAAPMFDTEGRLMNLDKLYFNIVADGVAHTLTPDEYSWLDEPMTDIPYSLDNYDFYCTGEDHSAYFYFSGYEKVGIQMVYRGGGEEHRSNIVYYTDPESGIHAIGEGRAVSETYTDLAGRRANASAKGLLIRTRTMADCTKLTDKIAK